MNFNEYQDFTNETAKYAGQRTVAGLVYATLGLAGEAGELANKVKKIIRDANGVLTEEIRLALLDEGGDCQWYLARIATELNALLEDMASGNVAKLKGRKERGTLHGSGDNR